MENTSCTQQRGKLAELLTVVIPCKNEQCYIFHALYSLALQREVNGMRVIVADAGSTDHTLKRVGLAKELYEGRINIEVVEGGYPAFGRNAGAKLATTPYVLFMDADVRLFSGDNLMDNVEKMQRRDLDLLSCCVDSYANSFRSKVAFVAFNLFNRAFSLFEPFCVGGYFMTKLSKFRELGGFDERIKVCEDYMLSKRYDRCKFAFSYHKYGQDDRRFRKYGYTSMVKLMVLTFLNRNNPKYFESDMGYWK